MASKEVGDSMDTQLEEIAKKNIGMLMELLEAFNMSDGVRKLIKSFIWKIIDEIKLVNK
jgi:carbon monoxide dehydrogenase subunit G